MLIYMFVLALIKSIFSIMIYWLILLIATPEFNPVISVSSDIIKREGGMSITI